jgi:Flp pilus assembly protein protease CpaA
MANNGADGNFLNAHLFRQIEKRFSMFLSNPMLIFGFVVGLIGLLIGSYTDIKTKEVPDWLNFSLIAIGLGMGVLASIIYWDITFFLSHLIGLGIGVGIGYFMYYAGQWGGGDSKMIMGLSAIIGFDIFNTGWNMPFVAFMVNVIVVGAVYGIAMSIFLAIKHRKEFMKQFRELRTHKTIMQWRKIIVVVCVAGVIWSFFISWPLSVFVFGIFAIIFFMFCVWILGRVIEQACMIKKVAVSKLTEGDWILKDVKVKGKLICGPKDLGIKKEQIKELKRLRVKEIWVKEGIAFVPSFLIAFLLTYLVGNWLLFMF